MSEYGPLGCTGMYGIFRGFEFKGLLGLCYETQSIGVIYHSVHTAGLHYPSLRSSEVSLPLPLAKSPKCRPLAQLLRLWFQIRLNQCGTGYFD